MIISPASLSDVMILEPELRADERGYFFRNFCIQELTKAGIGFSPVQVNRAHTKKAGTLRGLHFQIVPHEEVKVFQCLAGAVFDVVVDVRRDSKNFGRWFGIELSAANKKMLYVPKGFAHGYETLIDDTEVQYFVSEAYAPESERGLRYDDPSVGIRWVVPPTQLSDKDRNLSSLSDL